MLLQMHIWPYTCWHRYHMISYDGAIYFCLKHLSEGHLTVSRGTRETGDMVGWKDKMGVKNFG